MIIGIPKEIKDNENRVGMTPSGVSELVKRGHNVYVQHTAGDNSGFQDKEYEAVGAKILPAIEDVYALAEMIVKVKEPIKPEYKLIQEEQLLFTYFHFASDKELTDAMIKTKAICLAYETVELPNGSLPLLIPMSEVAGRMSIQEGARFLEKPQQGKGILLGGVPGVKPAKVLILGAGTVGINAAITAAGAGAEVTITDISLPRLRYLDAILPKNVTTLFSSEHHIRTELPTTDLIIGSVLIPGSKTPHLITKDMHILNKSLGWHRYALEMSKAYKDKTSLESTINRLNCLKGIGCTQYELRNYTEADSAFRKCLGGYQQTGMHLEEAFIDTYLGKIFEMKQENDSALIYYQLALIRNCQENSKINIAISYSNIGRILENKGNDLSAAENFETAFRLLDDNKNIELSLEIGLALTRINIKLGKMAEAKNYLNFALYKIEKLHSFSLLTALYKIRSIYYQKSGDMNQAVLDLQQAQIFSDSMDTEIDNDRNLYLKLSYDQQQVQKKKLESSEQIETLKKHNLHWAIGIMITILLLSGCAITILIYFLRLRRRAAKMQEHMETVKNNFFTNVTHGTLR